MSQSETLLPMEIRIAALNRSTKDVYFVLKQKRHTAADLQRKTQYSPRTVRAALKQLLDLQLIMRVPNFTDLRSCWYQAINIY